MRFAFHRVLGLSLCVGYCAIGSACCGKSMTLPPSAILETSLKFDTRVAVVFLPEGSLSKSTPGCEQLMQATPLEYLCGCPISNGTVLAYSGTALVVTLGCTRHAPTVEFSPFDEVDYPLAKEMAGATLSYLHLKPTSRLSEEQTVVRGTVSRANEGILSFECRGFPGCLEMVSTARWLGSQVSQGPR